MYSFFVFCAWITSTIVNPVCFKCILGINLSQADKSLLTISLPFINLFNTINTKEDLLKKFYLNVFLFLNYLIIHWLLAAWEILIFYNCILLNLIKHYSSVSFLCNFWIFTLQIIIRWVYVIWGRIAYLLATYAWKSKLLGSSPAASYEQRWALCNNRVANV